MTTPYSIDLARPQDIALLPAIERDASSLFAGYGLNDAVLYDSTTVDDFESALRAGLLWVARDSNGKPVGFAFVDMIDGEPHLDELDVHPDHGRRGLGRELVEAVCAWAQTAGHQYLTLTTFLDIPWNAPFYAKIGFRVLETAELTPALAEVVCEESTRGLDPARRCVMRRDLTRARM